MQEVEESCSFNVGGCVFSIHPNRLNYFKDSLLLKSVRGHGDNSTLFIDRDASAFRHVYNYINTGNLTSSCLLEMNILHELATGLHLTALQQVGLIYSSPLDEASSIFIKSMNVYSVCLIGFRKSPPAHWLHLCLWLYNRDWTHGWVNVSICWWQMIISTSYFYFILI